MRYSPRVTFLAIACVAMAAVAVRSDTAAMGMSQETESKTIKEELQFSFWPGKHGSLKPGVKVVLSAIPSLAGFTVSRDSVSLKKAGGSPVILRTLTLAQGDDALRISIRVSQSSTEQAQEALLTLLGATQAPLSLAWLRGDQKGIQVGDLNFVGGRPPGKLGSVCFVRNNLCVSIQGLNGPMGNLLETAKAIDALIVQEPDLTREELEAQVPVIHQFAAKTKTLAPWASTPVTLDVVDPQGRALQYQFDGNLGQIQVDKSKSPPGVTVRANGRTGRFEISVLVVDENLLFSSSQTDITVQD